MWLPGQPNGKDIEECLHIHSKSGLFIDRLCTSIKACFVCAWNHEPTFKLRGLCRGAKVDRDYVLVPQLTYGENVFFSGFYKNDILFSQKKNSWVIVEGRKDDLFQLSNTTKHQRIVGHLISAQNNNVMPFGLHLWNITECGGKTWAKLTSVSNVKFIALNLNVSFQNFF